MKTSTSASRSSKSGKKNQFIGLRKKIIIFCTAVFAILTFGSCTKKIVFPVSSTLPAAHASAKIKTDKNGNYSIDLTVKHIANPERLTPSRKFYVVWIETSQNGVVNLGQLRISNKLNGSLKTISSFKPISIFITAEDDPATKVHGMNIVLKTDSFDL